MSNASDFVIENGVLKKYTGPGGDVVIPEGVAFIGGNAFEECGKLTSVVIPEGVTSIGNRAFSDCDSLTSVVIPEGVTSIGESAFEGCSSLTSVVIPEGVTSIGDRAFIFCSSLTSVVIPEGVTSIGRSAFYGCENLTRVVIPEGVTSIGESAFEGCSSLTRVVIPESVTFTGDRAFHWCDQLAEHGLIIVRDTIYGIVGEIQDLVIPEGVTSIGESAFEGCRRLTSVVIPEGVTSIGESAFRDCSRLTSVVIPEGVTSIGERAFWGCSSLTSVVIPEGVTSIGERTFWDCSSLTSVVIPEGVTSIGESAFWGCSSLTSVVIPESVISIGEVAFEGCKKLEYISSLSPSCKMAGKVFTGCQFTQKLYTCLGGIYHAIPDPALKNALLPLGWSRLSAEAQVDLFVSRQAKPLLSAYPVCIKGQDIETLGRGILEKLSKSPSGKLYKAAVNYMILLEKDIPDDLLHKLYVSLKGKKAAAKALESLADHISLMERLKLDTTVDESLPLAEKLVKEMLLAEKQSIKDLEGKLKSIYGLTFSDLPELLYKYGSVAAPCVLAWLLTAHEKLEEGVQNVTAAYKQPGVRPEAAKVIAGVDSDSLQKALSALASSNLGISGKSKKMFLAYPICRYANEELMANLTKAAPSWSSRVSGNDAPPLRTFRMACLYSETKAAMLFTDKYLDLDQYAKIRGTDTDTIRDQYLSDVGLDPQGGKAYDLGNQAVVARLQKDLSFLVEVPGAKMPAKSIPKKGADGDKYAAANADFTEMKKNVKKILKNRNAALFADFLSGRKRNAADWKQAYLNNPLLRMAASLLVWQQDGKTLILSDAGSVDAAGNPVAIKDCGGIALAHPMEMQPEEVTAWQKYFTSRGLKQPFAQIWEPVVDSGAVKTDRYKDCSIPYYRFLGQEKHGIYATDLDLHYMFTIKFQDCDADVKRIDGKRNTIDPDERFAVNSISFKAYTRQVNHIIAYLDRVTAYDRIRQDDVAVAEILPRFTLAQITEFIKVAAENNCTNVMAVLLEYKNTHYADFDPMEEFTLE